MDLVQIVDFLWVKVVLIALGQVSVVLLVGLKKVV
jgi:hypothetical protein